MRNVTDLETSKKLVKWMGGVETGKCHQTTLDCDMNVVWHIVDYNVAGIRRTIGTGQEPTVPAFSTDDLMERLPKVIHEKEDRPTEKLYIDFNRGLAGYSATGDILGFTHSRKIAHFESTVELRSALAQLVIFCGESGYLEEGKG